MKQAFLSNNIISSIEKSAGKESNVDINNICRKLRLSSNDNYPNIKAFNSENNSKAESQLNTITNRNNTEFDIRNNRKRFKDKN